MSPLHVLPVRTAGAAENMAVDFLLLKRYPEPTARFRHYEWRRAAFTFGYSQKYKEVLTSVACLGGEGGDLCRRPTGGGIVDHRDDWTYALVVPRGHPLEELRAAQSYRVVHEALSLALQAQGVPAKLQEETPEGEPGVCFTRAEPADVVHGVTKAKIAGAAQKRTKQGLLFQGSISKSAAGRTVDWEQFHEDFSSRIAAVLQVEARQVPWPEISDDEVGALSDLYASPEWNEQR